MTFPLLFYLGKQLVGFPDGKANHFQIGRNFLEECLVLEIEIRIFWGKNHGLPTCFG